VPKILGIQGWVSETLTADIYGLFDAGFGIAFRSSELPDDSFIKAKSRHEL
jgi:hypothetical protein